jgi:hypothetical protein
MAFRGMFRVAGEFEGTTLWASLHDGELAWTDCAADAVAWPEATARFIREARAPAWLDRPRVVAPFNYSAMTGRH